MKNSKKLFLIFLSVLIVAFVSCKKDSGGSITTPTPTFKPSSLLGSWTFDGETSAAANNTLELTEENNNLTIKVKAGGASGNITIDTWADDKDKEVAVYEKTGTETDNGQAVGKATPSVKFTSATTCSATVSVVKDGNTTVYNANFKKQQ